MVFILWILRLIAPIVRPLGILGAICMLSEEVDQSLWIISGVLAFVGLIFGFTNWALEVPPRFFWVSSKLDAFGDRFSAAIGYALLFFSFVPCYWIVNFFLDSI